MTTSRLTLFSLCCVLSSSVISQAAVPIERRSLSDSNPSASAPTVAGLPIAPLLEPSQPNMLWQLTEQVQQLQEEVRRLRGNNESQEQTLEALQKELRSRFIDFDQRLEQLQEQLRSKTEADASVDSGDLATAPASDSSSSGVIPPSTLNAAAASTSPKVTSPSPTEEKSYIAAYDAYKAGGTQKAIAAMQQFINDYPNSVYIPNAHYWLGEFYLTLTPPNFVEAQKEFNLVMSIYPKSARAAAAIYRLASIAEIEKRSAEATRLMNTLRQNYPSTTEAGYAEEFLRKRSK